MTAVDDVVQVLAANGRTVDPQDISNELAGLEGLSESDAVTTLLECYGIRADGRPTRAFIPDFSARGPIDAVLREGRPAVVYTLLAAVLGVVPALIVPLGIRFFVDRYLVAGRQVVAVYVVVGFTLAAVMATVLVALQYAVLRRSYLRFSATGQAGFQWHMLRMRVDELARLAPGDLIARMNAEQRLAFQGGMLLPLAAVNIIGALAYTAALVALDPLMSATALFAAVLTAVSSLRVLSLRSRTQMVNDDERSELSAVASETLDSIESVKAAAWEQFAFARWSRVRQRMMVSQSNLGVANLWLVFMPAVGLALGLGLVLGVGAWQVIDGNLSLGTLVASQAFVALLLESVGLIIYLGVLLQGISSAGRQAEDILARPIDPEALDPLTPAPVSALEGEVRLRGVTFGYDRDEPPIVQDLDIHIPAGQRVALVGASGSGKTTIARLAIGELRPWSGVVEFDGIPRLRIPRDVRASDIAYVPQHPVLFGGTIRDNLTLWDPSIRDEDMRRAAQDACIESTILGRPGGYYAQLSGDAGFSGGERQRLAIARALAGNPKVLILDEATSALDPVVEMEVEENLRRRGCTCLVVAHRLSTVRDADEILVIEQGGVAQRGRFDQIKGHGHFAELLHG